MLTLTNFNLIVQLLVNVFRAQEASQNVILSLWEKEMKNGCLWENLDVMEMKW